MAFITYSDIQAVKTSGSTIAVEPLGVELKFQVTTNGHGIEYAKFINLDLLFDRIDVSFSKAERSELESGFDAIARGVE